MGCGTRVHRTGLRCTSLHRFRAAAVFYRISTQKGSAAESRCYIPWSQPPIGVTGHSALLAFKAGHASSIPVARSLGYRQNCRCRTDRTLAGGTEDETGPNAGHAPHCEIPGRPRVLPPNELVIQSGGPLAAGAADQEGARNIVKARECVTTQGSEVEDRGGAPAELAARFSAPTRTQPHEPSRSAGAKGLALLTEMSISSTRISMHELAYLHAISTCQRLSCSFVHRSGRKSDRAIYGHLLADESWLAGGSEHAFTLACGRRRLPRRRVPGCVRHPTGVQRVVAPARGRWRGSWPSRGSAAAPLCGSRRPLRSTGPRRCRSATAGRRA